MTTQKQQLYPQVDSNPDVAKIEEKILDFWQEKNIFNATLEIRQNDKHFVFYDGPPFANGLPHYGHLLTGFIKDLVARYQTMKGNLVERKFGWDCHGLPAEMGAEKELKISGRSQIMNYGVDKFNDYCRQNVLKYTKEWQNYVTRQARWVDFENDYKTMDINYMESVLWAFKQLYNKGLVYESLRVMPYSWACETPLSNFETKLDNSYRERADKAVTFAFVLKEKPESAPNNCNSYKLLAWTTMAWTIIPNLAIAVGKDIEYAAIIKDMDCYVLAKSSLKTYSKELGLTDEDIEQARVFKGEELVGLTYQPIYNYFAKHENAFQVLAGEFVTDIDGTGIVSIAPGFGEDDHIICNQNNIEIVCPVDDGGKFTAEIKEFYGQNVFDTIDEIIKYLKVNNLWIRTEQYLHNYPHCWRTDTPLIYKAVPSWYVEVTKFKDRMVELNQQINWIPNHIQNGLFGKWLENARDWSISRNRFWGTPIPIWRSDNPAYPRIDVYGSIAELEQDFGIKITDLHKPLCDELTRPNPDDPTGKSMMRRVPEVFDCWFESGSMSFAQQHYPFENKDKFEKNFPADFIVEYTAQTRGWFYTLMVLATALFDSPPFLNCICHGVILDDKKQKLSKRLNNFADPLELCAKYGADSLRFFMLSSSVMRGNELFIDKEGEMVKDTLRLAIKPLWNAYNFFTLYANSDQVKAELNFSSTHLLDQYILAKLKEMVLAIDQAIGKYDIAVSNEAFTHFIEVLNNWYIRRNRVRFWKSEKDSDKQNAYNTLYTVLLTVAKACAPMMPLITEEIYQGLNMGNNSNVETSVHLTNFPNLEFLTDQKDLVLKMDKVQQICSAALSIRNQENIRTRQPLNTLTILGKNLEKLQDFAELIRDEVNVKKVEFKQHVEEAAEFRLKINFPVLGKRLPGKIKDIIAASKNNNWQQNDLGEVTILEEKLSAEECEVMLIPKQTKGSCSLSSNDGLVVLDLVISAELEAEGFARDVVRMIQQERKDRGLNITDQILIEIELNSEDKIALTSYKNYIEEQTLSTISFEEEITGIDVIIKDLFDKKIKIRFK